MALNKKITRTNGIELNYHRIVEFSMKVDEYIRVKVASYVSSDMRTLDKDAGTNERIVFPYIEEVIIKETWKEMWENNELTPTELYSMLKEKDTFKDAEDV